MMDWKKYRDKNGNMELVLAFDEEIVNVDQDSCNWDLDTGYDFLAATVRLQPIVSRQAAAIALSTASSLSMGSTY